MVSDTTKPPVFIQRNQQLLQGSSHPTQAWPSLGVLMELLGLLSQPFYWVSINCVSHYFALCSRMFFQYLWCRWGTHTPIMLQYMQNSERSAMGHVPHDSRQHNLCLRHIVNIFRMELNRNASSCTLITVTTVTGLTEWNIP